jgi:Glycosyl hydrolase family 76
MNVLNAAECFSMMQYYFYDATKRLYRENYPPKQGDKPYSYLWTLREATAATIDMTRIPNIGYSYVPVVEDHLKSINLYWDCGKYPAAYDSYLPPAGGDIYYDDNTIVALEFLRWYRMTKNPAALQSAIQIFPLLEYGWDSDPKHPSPGGMLWTQANNPNPMIRGANVTGLMAQVSAHLYEETKISRYLDWAKKAYDWNRRVLRSPDGVYWNDMDLAGQINKTYWVYNAGIMLGAATQLCRVTGDKTYLGYAQQDADSALSYWTTQSKFLDQPAIFCAFFFKNLLLLDSLAHNEKYKTAMQAYADSVWTQKRDLQTGLFSFIHPVPLLDAAAMTQIYACLSWASSDYALIA